MHCFFLSLPGEQYEDMGFGVADLTIISAKLEKQTEALEKENLVLKERCEDMEKTSEESD